MSEGSEVEMEDDFYVLFHEFFSLCFRVVRQSGRPSHSCWDGWMCPVFTSRNSEFE